MALCFSLQSGTRYKYRKRLHSRLGFILCGKASYTAIKLLSAPLFLNITSLWNVLSLNLFLQGERVTPATENIRTTEKENGKTALNLTNMFFYHRVPMKASEEAISFFRVFQDCEGHSQFFSSMWYTINAAWRTTFIEVNWLYIKVLEKLKKKMYLSTCT